MSQRKEKKHMFISTTLEISRCRITQHSTSINGEEQNTDTLNLYYKPLFISL
jgi:hypothetical protein